MKLAVSNIQNVSNIPMARPGVGGMLDGTEVSLRPDRAEVTRGPDMSDSCLLGGNCDEPAPPEPVLLIDSPPAESAVLPGTGDGAADVFDTPTFLICARTCDNCLS